MLECLLYKGQQKQFSVYYMLYFLSHKFIIVSYFKNKTLKYIFLKYMLCMDVFLGSIRKYCHPELTNRL